MVRCGNKLEIRFPHSIFFEDQTIFKKMTQINFPNYEDFDKML